MSSHTHFGRYNEEYTIDRIPSYTLRYMSNVYQTLLVLCGMYTFGIMFGIYVDISADVHLVTTISTLVLVVAVVLTEGYRYMLSCILSFLLGIDASKLIECVLHIDPLIVPICVLGTCLIFISMSVVSRFIHTRYMLMLGSIVVNGVFLTLYLGFINMFIMSDVILSFQIYGGLVLFALYTIYDTYLMMERATNHRLNNSILNSDIYVLDSLALFLDIVNMLIRIVMLLSKINKRRENYKYTSYYGQFSR